VTLPSPPGLVQAAGTAPSPFDAHSGLATKYAGRSNPAFDPRRYSTNPWYGKLEQGLMVQDQPSTSGQIEKLRFLYNPSDWSVSMDTNSAIQPAAATDPADAAANVLGSSPTSVGFSLLFDRTYELRDGNYLMQSLSPFSKRPYSQPSGVDADVLAFRRLVGIPDDGNGIMLQVALHVFLGSSRSPYFFGFVTHAEVAYTHFSSEMIPMRCVISVSMSQMVTTPEIFRRGPGNNQGGSITTEVTNQGTTVVTPGAPAPAPGVQPPPAPAPPPPAAAPPLALPPGARAP